MSRFFIDRPIFANVIAVITVIIGAVALGRKSLRTTAVELMN
jgi:multidrug efflux pump subunit AcrB